MPTPINSWELLLISFQFLMVWILRLRSLYNDVRSRMLLSMMLCLWMEGDGENSHFLARLDHSKVLQQNILKKFENLERNTFLCFMPKVWKYISVVKESFCNSCFQNFFLFWKFHQEKTFQSLICRKSFCGTWIYGAWTPGNGMQ